MILVLKQNCSDDDTNHVVSQLQAIGIRSRIIRSADRALVAVDGEYTPRDLQALDADPAVELIVPTVPRCSAQVTSSDQTSREVRLGPHDAVIGGSRLGIIAGPCSVESKSQLLDAAFAVKAAGAIGLRGGAFKPRTNPHSFQGLGERALEFLAEAREATGLPIVTEVMSVDQVEVVTKYADVLQIGARSMHNSNLLSAVGRTDKSILLKRGWSATLDEFLHAAEYIINEGNSKVILCERGIRTFETYVRNTLALAIVPAIKQRSPLPMIVDPSHGTGVADLVTPLSKAAIACGADGLLIEVHPDPTEALSDGDQSLNIPQFQSLMAEISLIAPVVGRTL